MNVAFQPDWFGSRAPISIHPGILAHLQRWPVRVTHYFNRLKLAINDRTHVVPPSFEYDSSYWCEPGLMSDHTALTRIVLPFTVS